MNAMQLKFCGSRALILGGSCQMALELAEAMISLGICPLLTYRSESGRGRVDAHLDVHAGKYRTLMLDLDAANAADRLEAGIDSDIDYLVDFAQADFEGLVASADMDAAGRFFYGSIAMRTKVVQQVARRMVGRRKGRMVYVSSTAAVLPNSGQGFYAAAKQAVEAIYRSLGVELAGRGITTVILRPGYVDAGRGSRYLEHNREQVLNKVPLGRPLEVKEVVDAVLYLLSDHAVGFNATALTMDGGAVFDQKLKPAGRSAFTLTLQMS